MTHVETPVDEVDEAQTPVEPRGRRRFTLGQRFFLVFGFESLMIIGLALLGGIQLSLQGADEVDAIEDVDAVHTSLYDLNEALWQVRVQGMALTIDATTLQEFDDAYTDFTADYAHAFGEAFVEDQEMVAAWETLKASGMTSADDVNFVIFNSSVQEALESAADQVAAMTADEIASTEAHAQTVVLVFVVLAAIGVAHGILLGVIMTRRIGGSVRRLKDVTQAMADGDLTVDVSIDSSDEIGDMARSLARAQSSLRETMAGVVSSAVTVAAAAEELSAANAQVDASSQQTVAGASVVASSADEVSRSVQAVASGAEQMGASIKEISHNANEAARVAAQATDVAESTNEKVGRLGASSQEIGEVIKVISSIAEQTNLLALNATIEAARAGEAGKGFAVVASEVKDLAQETAKATEEVARRVSAIQEDTGGAVEAIGEISAIVKQINDFQLTIASAVEEQTATTAEMSRGVAEAATGSSGIAGTITALAQAAGEQAVVRDQIGTSVRELAELSAGLRAKVATFTY